MTAVSSSSNRGFGTPQRTSETDSDQWDFSVPDPLASKQDPLPSQQGPIRAYHQNGASNLSTHYDSDPRQRAKTTRLDEMDHYTVNEVGSVSKGSKKNHNMDTSYLSPFKNDAKPGSRGSRNSSEPDSLLDLYGRGDGRAMGEHTPDSKRSAFAPPEATPPVEEAPAEQSSWIHRDKLLLIEKQEMQELGIATPPAPRPASRSKSRRDRSKDTRAQKENEEEQDLRSAKEGKRRRLRSPIRQVEEEEPPQNDHEPQTPEEPAPDSKIDQNASPVYRQQHLRSSSSRIPLPRSSPMPMPGGADKGPTTGRRRGTSSGEEGGPYTHSRSRNNSVGSQNLLNDAIDPATPLNATQGSPTKVRSTSKTNAHSRKTSFSTPDGAKSPTSTSRTPSTSTPAIRPRSRQGLEPRPPTAINRPEGEPPWIKEMYKPDPRLPPEQQMLPTHAKRLQQEQWEQARKESEARQQVNGKRNVSDTPVERDKDKNAQGRGFSPVAVHTRDGLQPPNSAGLEQERSPTREANRDKPLPSTRHDEIQKPQQSVGGEWPLSQPSERKSSLAVKTSPISPTSGEGRNAGYSPLPPRAPPQGLRQDGSTAAGPRSGREGGAREKALSDPFVKEKLARAEAEQEGKEKEKKEKGCCGCVMM